jgi:hypothetical protein
MTDSTIDFEDSVTDTNPFVEDQQSLQTTTGVMMTLGMVCVAAFMCGAAIYIAL